MASAGYGGSGKGGCGGGQSYGAGGASYGRGGGQSYGGGAGYGRGSMPGAYGPSRSAYQHGAGNYNQGLAGKLYGGQHPSYSNNSGSAYGRMGASSQSQYQRTSSRTPTTGGMPAFLLGLMKGYQNSKNNTDGTKPYKTAPRPDKPDQKYNPQKENQDPREDEHKCPRCGGFSLFGAVCPQCK